jgi:iron complex outermembrane receptor protein
LKQEESQSASVGFTAKIPEQITLMLIIVTIKDRVVLTDQFSRPGGTPLLLSIKHFV